MMIRILLLSFFLASPMAVQAFTPTPVEKPNYAGFEQWVEEYKSRAEQAGIKRSLMDKALAGKKPRRSIIKLDRNQAGSGITKEEYLERVINQNRINTGRKLLKQHAALLNDVSAKYGVEKEFIVALWGLETGYGKNTGGFSVIEALATLAYDGRRREFFEKELLNALLIIQNGHITEKDMKGSWAGAMGQCQFMPTSFFKYAVDYNGDEKKDIWNTKSDVFASIGNYLATVGWGKSADVKEKALLDWNKSSYFVASVFKLAWELGYDGETKN